MTENNLPDGLLKLDGLIKSNIKIKKSNEELKKYYNHITTIVEKLFELNNTININYHIKLNEIRAEYNTEIKKLNEKHKNEIDTLITEHNNELKKLSKSQIIQNGYIEKNKFDDKISLVDHLMDDINLDISNFKKRKIQ